MKALTGSAKGAAAGKDDEESPRGKHPARRDGRASKQACLRGTCLFALYTGDIQPDLMPACAFACPVISSVL